jgi:hypothetical protein
MPKPSKNDQKEYPLLLGRQCGKPKARVRIKKMPERLFFFVHGSKAGNWASLDGWATEPHTSGYPETTSYERLRAAHTGPQVERKSARNSTDLATGISRYLESSSFGTVLPRYARLSGSRAMGNN